MNCIMFQFTRKGFNDTGKVYIGEVVERFINGMKVRVGDEVRNIMYEDVRILEDDRKEVRSW